MPGTKCPTVRSGGTTSVRSALMPILMNSRASMEYPVSSRPSEARAGTHNHEWPIVEGWSPSLPQPQAPVVMGPCFRRDDSYCWTTASLLLHRLALDEGL